jgi:hypothetical protein
MEMRAGYLFAIWISMRGSVKVEPYKDYGFPSTILKGGLLEINSSSPDIKQEGLLLINGYQRNYKRVARIWLIRHFVISPQFWHGN